MSQEAAPTLDDIRRVYERHSITYGSVTYRPEKRIGIGWVEMLDDEIPAKLKAPPSDPSEIINWGKPHSDYLTSEQIWQREETPHCWSKREILRQAKIYGNLRWFEEIDNDGVPKYATLEMMQFASRHWKMRKDGVWILINNDLVWLTGLHWYYLQWCWIGKGYPDYRDSDRYFFYAWESICQNGRLAGMTFLKPRRYGATFKALSFILEFATRSKATTSYIASNTLAHAQKSIYMEKMVPMYDNVPEFFRPYADGYDKPKNGFVFDTPPRKGKAILDQREGLKSTIMLTKSADGSKLHAGLIDESAKYEEGDIYELVKVIVPTMVDEGMFIGKLMLPTTMEEARSEVAIGCFRRLWDASSPALAKKSGTRSTPSKIARLFFPAWYGLYDDIAFIGRFGEAIIEKPNQDQLSWLSAKYESTEEEDDAWGSSKSKSEIWKEHGSWSYLKLRRSEMANDTRALASELRKYPFTVEEAFRPSVGSAIIDPLICGNAMADLCRIQPDGRTFSDHIVKRGNIDGVPGNYYFTESKQGVYEVSVRFLEFMEREELKEKVHRQSKPAGRNSLEPENEKTRPYSFNDIQQSPQGWRPATKRGFIGLDPIDMDKKHRQTSKLSDMAAVAFWCYDIDIDGETYRDGGAREMLSNSFVARYRHRHASKTTDFQNVLKLAMWLGYEIHFEMNRGESFRDYLIAMDAIFFKAKSPLEAHLRKRTANSRGAPPVDTYTSEFVHQKGTEKIQLWVDEFGSALTCPFIEIWQEFMRVDLKDMQPFDEYVAVEYALLKGAPGIISQAEKKSHIATKPKAAPGGSVYEAFY